MFNNRNMVCHGSRTMRQARIRVRQYARLVQKLGYEVSLSHIKLITASALADVGRSMELASIAKFVPGASYEPEFFNAATVKRGGVHFSIFASGKVVIADITRFSLKNEVVLLELVVA